MEEEKLKGPEAINVVLKFHDLVFTIEHKNKIEKILKDTRTKNEITKKDCIFTVTEGCITVTIIGTIAAITTITDMVIRVTKWVKKKCEEKRQQKAAEVIAHKKEEEVEEATKQEPQKAKETTTNKTIRRR